jgi:putative heme-binding domain-containing protein
MRIPAPCSLIIASLLACPLHAAPQRNAEPATAESLLKTVKAPTGWKVSIFALPPEVGYPTCLSTSPEGDLYVGIDENGSIDAKGGRGRVVRCTDTDGDGKADKFITFAQMDSPRGIWFDHDTLYVMHPPLLQAFHDDNRDGVADRQEVLVDGLGFDLKFRGADHTVNGMRMAIDGFLYIAVGDYGATNAIGKDGARIQLWGGGVVRVRPDGTGLEIVSQGQRNIYDVAVSPEMDLFTRDNTNDGGGWDVRLTHVVLGGNYGYPRLYMNFPAEILQPLADYGGGSPCGALFMDEPGFPEGFGRGLYTVEWGRNGIFRHPLTFDGASYKAGQEKFIELPRPTDFDVDGSGRLYIASWHGATFTYAGPNAGFIAQVVPEKFALKPFANLKKASVPELLKLLGSPSAFARLHAQREMLRRAKADQDSTKKEMLDGINALVLGDGPVASRIAGIYTFAQMTEGEARRQLKTFAAKPELVEASFRAASDDVTWLKTLPADAFTRFLTDTNPRARLQAVTLLGRRGDASVADKLLPLTGDGDPIIAHLAIRALTELRAADVCLATFDSPGSASLQPAAARVLQGLHEPTVVDGVIARLRRATDAEQRRLLLGTLARLYNREADWDGKWWGTRPDTTGPYYKPVTWALSEKISEVLKESLKTTDGDTLRFLAVSLQKNRVDLPELTQTVLKLAGEDTKFRAVAVEMFAGRSTLPEAAIPLFAAVGMDQKSEPALRAKAARALGKNSSNPAALDAVVAVLTTEDRPPGELNSAWDDFARDTRQSRNVAYFAKLMESGSANPRLLACAVMANVASARLSDRDAKSAAERAVNAAWGRGETVTPMLRAVARLKLDGYATQVRGLMSDGRPEVAAAAKEAARALKLGEAAKGTTGPLIEALKYEDLLAGTAKGKGDAKRGGEIFTKSGCVACHTTRSDEMPKGPFLGGIATRYSRAELCESILKPNEKIAQGFETQWFKNKEGDDFEGFVTREGGDDLDVRNIAGITTTLAKKEIAERGKRETSMMPAGLLDKLTAEDLDALLAFLEGLKAN